jgi:Tfp pilus assembly protein PilF
MNRLEKLEALLADSPGDPFLRYALALAYASEGNAVRAQEGLDVLLQSNPDYVPAYLQLAQLHFAHGRADLARPVLVSGIEMARRAGESHAEDEMRGFLDQLS